MLVTLNRWHYLYSSFSKMTVMTVVTVFWLYSGIAVIVVIAVTLFETHQTTLSGALCPVLDAHRSEHLTGKATENFGDEVGRRFSFSHC